MNEARRTNISDVPFDGELRESKWSKSLGTLGVGLSMILATLQSDWVYCGFIVDPGDSDGSGTGLSAALRVLEPGLSAILTPTVIVVLPGRVQAFGGFIVGGRVELVVTNNTTAVITGLRGSVWGMSRG
jgi:hypothetical protein